MVTVASTVLAYLMFGRFELANLVMVFLLGVVFIATRFGRGPSIFASFLGVAIIDLLFVKPYYSFSVADSTISGDAPGNVDRGDVNQQSDG